MTRKIKQYFLRLSIAGLLLTPALAPVVHAQPDLRANLCGGSEQLQLGEEVDCEEGTAEDNVNNLITSIINIFSAIVGVIAVIMIVYGGFRYITSGGDSGKISSAQQSIIYAIVGLIVVALAQVIVRFVLFRAVQGQVE